MTMIQNDVKDVDDEFVDSESDGDLVGCLTGRQKNKGLPSLSRF